MKTTSIQLHNQIQEKMRFTLCPQPQVTYRGVHEGGSEGHRMGTEGDADMKSQGFDWWCFRNFVAGSQVKAIITVITFHSFDNGIVVCSGGAGHSMIFSLVFQLVHTTLIIVWIINVPKDYVFGICSLSGCPLLRGREACRRWCLVSGSRSMSLKMLIQLLFESILYVLVHCRLHHNPLPQASIHVHEAKQLWTEGYGTMSQNKSFLS